MRLGIIPDFRFKAPSEAVIVLGDRSQESLGIPTKTKILMITLETSSASFLSFSLPPFFLFSFGGGKGGGFLSSSTLRTG